MSNYAYIAVDPTGTETRGTLEVANQSEALRRIKEMGLFPTRVLGAAKPRAKRNEPRPKTRVISQPQGLRISFGRKIKPRILTTFTRQLATLIEAGMPLLRGLRLLHEQAETRVMKDVLASLALSIETGSSLTEAVNAHPKIFN